MLKYVKKKTQEISNRTTGINPNFSQSKLKNYQNFLL